MITKLAAVVFLGIAGLGCMLAQEQLGKQLLENRYDLNLKDGHLSGAGAEVLRKAIASAQFVLIGEQHGNAETPEFSSAICDLAVPQGFHSMAIETGPMMAGQLEKWARSTDSRHQVAEFQKEFPDALPFYRLQEETDLLAHCSHTAENEKFHIWGLDQEFYGESRFLLQSLLNSHPGKAAAAKIRQMFRENDQAYARTVASGKVNDIFMLSVPDSEILELKNSVAREGNPASQAILNAFIESRDIYHKYLQGEAYDSNLQRALMMKALFARYYDDQTRAEGKPAKVLLKFGSAHLYKGINPLHNDDLGNFVAELAEGHHSTSLHINIIGVKGAEISFGAPGQPPQLENFDLVQDTSSAVFFIKPLLDHRLPEGWTLYDLRGLRRRFKALGPVDEELERLIFGYDIVIMVPKFTPSTPIQ